MSPLGPMRWCSRLRGECGIAWNHASELALGFLVLFAAALGACKPNTPPRTADGRLPVVATFSILGDIVSNVGGDRISLTTFVGPDGDAHTYEPTPGDARLLAQAAVVVENGLGFEAWLDKLLQSSGSKAARVAVSAGIQPRTLIEAGQTETDQIGRASCGGRV